MKTLQECKDEVAKKHGFDSWYHVLSKRLFRLEDVDNLTTEAAELYASEAIREKKEWISTKDRLPDYNVSVLVFIPEENDHITTGMWDISKKWVLLDEYRVPTCHVTYWREMVYAPEDKSYEKTHNDIDESDTVTYKIRELQKQNYAKDKEIEQLKVSEYNRAIDDAIAAIQKYRGLGLSIEDCYNGLQKYKL